MFVKDKIIATDNSMFKSIEITISKDLVPVRGDNYPSIVMQLKCVEQSFTRTEESTLFCCSESPNIIKMTCQQDLTQFHSKQVSLLNSIKFLHRRIPDVCLLVIELTEKSHTPLDPVILWFIRGDHHTNDEVCGVAGCR